MKNNRIQRISYLHKKRLYEDKINKYKENERKLCYELFNNCEFTTLKYVLDNIDLDEKDRLNSQRLVDFYMYWDNLDYNNVVSYEFRPFPKLFKSINNQYQANVKGWMRLKKYDFEFILTIDLINKAKRYYLQDRYNEAILCIYRACELISSMELWEQYQINTEKLSIDRLKKMNIDADFINKLSMDHKFHHTNISLKKNFELLYQLNDRIGQYYHLNRFDFNDIITIRHHSMLVHGINRVTSISYYKYEYLVRGLVNLFDRDALKLLELTEFPRFE